MAVSFEATENALSNGQAPRERLSASSAAGLWRPTTPQPLRAAWKNDPHGRGWDAVRTLLAGHAAPKRLRTGGKKRPDALLWGTNAELAAWQTWLSDLRAMIAKQDSAAVTAEVQRWADRTDRRAADETLALECLAWAYELPSAAQCLESEIWWGLVEHLHEIALQTFEVSLGEAPTATLAFAHQALGGELPLVLSRTLPEAKPLHAARKLSARLLSEGLVALTDGEGLPTAKVLPRLPMLAACWTRCRTWAQREDKPCWNSDAQTQYEWLVRQALRLAGRDGRLALTGDYQGGLALLDQMLRIAGDDSDHQAACERLRVRGYDSNADTPEPSVNSEWSGLAVLAAEWDAKAPRAVVGYHGRQAHVEFCAAGRAMISGAWTTEVTVAGERLEATDDWEEQCWLSDEDCDYLELSLPLTGGAELVRQLLVTREDRLTYLCDIVLTGRVESQPIDVVQRWPLAEGVVYAGESETREGWLNHKDKPLACVTPAGLPEWRIDPEPGELATENGELVLRQSGAGRNLGCPLFIDAAPRRAAKQRTWRRLTVAEALEQVEPDVAVAYRYQSGNQQWVAYRSLDEKANRTFLGHNLASEALFGRFLKDGEVESFFEIEDEE